MKYYVVTERENTRELLDACKKRLTKTKCRRLDDHRNITEIESGLITWFNINRKFNMKRAAKLFAMGS